MPSRLPALHVTTDGVGDLDVDALVVPVFRGAIEAPGAEQALQALGLDEVPRDARFRGRLGEVLDLAAPGQPWGRVTLVGLGRMDELSGEQLRRAAGSAARHLAPTCRAIATTLVLVQPAVETVRAVAEGVLLGAYRFDDCRPGRDPLEVADVTLVVPSSLVDAADRQLQLARTHAAAQNIARDLVSTPPNLLGPDDIAQRADGLVSAGVEVEVWDEARLIEERCGGILAVGRGSARPPRLVKLHYRPDSPVAKVALVGKGITFDTGGISLKRPSEIMESMKGDMGGAGAVLAVFSALADLDVKVEVVGYLCLAENMIGADAQRPSDVITIRNGTTVEVMNTDAEGRLVMADGLSLAVEDDDVEAVVDVATLTGAAARALGKRASAVFANDDDLLRQVLTASEAAGEAMWHLPLWEELRDNLESEVADIDNIGRGDEAGATIAGLFLREFVDGRPWVHLDIAGPFWQDEDRYHNPRHGTGVAVRTLLRWLEMTGR
ncbi:leucyl aminopeptidase [Egicoccus sp. AB-alg6-2]|uniref:leucyl aminopeptidase n=1 Tax=Egicoccus sp. AB-alg6-2 TaxID=3242692 RepID=UPI00359EF077